MTIEVGNEEVVVEVAVPEHVVSIDVVNPIVEISAVTHQIEVKAVSPVVDISVTAPTLDVEVVAPVIDVSINANTGGISVHGDLSELEMDDHPQYLSYQRADLRYSVLAVRLDFPVPQSTWVVDIGTPCHVIVYDSSKRIVEPGTIMATGTTELTLIFSAPFSGVAYCYT
jgi:hypothetical protein